MELSIRELNELIYCIDVARKHGQLLGTTVADKLAVRLRDELDERLKPDYLHIPNDKLKQAAKRYSDEVRAKHIHIDEDSFTKVLNKAEAPKRERGWIVQKMLDYVDYCGAVSHTQLENYYKAITNSNSFSHCLINLRTPYKNRKTQRYLAKEGKKGSNAKWVVKVANPSNWIIVKD
jgi:hypothetical protein